ncbi:hypothetical protein QLQ12_25255 [Actinoplanes sp. NEAU-A12]|uniref:Uncharacterized protein n=1 Tax=Actinoplanes sandaracinus TaxID=3045177 RepID=A0ABT6WQL6_9ACTN|nr:hypothetical protein [Actinoplanes sandaracinus]MDI6101930.1 hypothetical protein [Actinoplanes sandaracinus]
MTREFVTREFVTREFVMRELVTCELVMRELVTCELVMRELVTCELVMREPVASRPGRRSAATSNLPTEQCSGSASATVWTRQQPGPLVSRASDLLAAP